MDGQQSLNQIFDRILTLSHIFRDKEKLRHSYSPKILPHREKEIEELAGILVSAIKGETPSNIFVYGKTGTGKTAVITHVGKALVKKVGGKIFSGQNIEQHNTGKNNPVFFIYMNCEMIDTQYRLLSKLAEYMGQSVPLTGWPTDKVYEMFFSALDDSEKLVIVVLDEIDKLLRKGSDDILYSLTRINSDLKKAKVSIIGISNDLNFIDFLDPRVRSSLGEEEIIFAPYDALQLIDILNQRVAEAFTEGSLEEDVIPLCAAFAAQEHGDARRALDLLRMAAELAERENSLRVRSKHVKISKEKIETDRVIEVIKTLPTQSKLVLYSVLFLEKYGMANITTGETYNTYRELARKSNIDILTQRRVSDLINELDMLGILNSAVISKGRYGRSKEMKLATPHVYLKKILDDDARLSRIANYVPPMQHRLG